MNTTISLALPTTMNPKRLPILETLRACRATRDGTIVIWGSIIQIPMVLLMFGMAWSRFPQSITDSLLLAGFLHLCIPVTLVGSWMRYSVMLQFRKSTVLSWFLLLISCTPFFLSLPLL